jgi:adenylosuccinate synthase
MPNTCVVGMQWGDEAKARIVDVLAQDADLVVRYQGGSNAGHTVVVGSQKYIFHLIPTGIIHPGKTCVIANGVVLDPKGLLEELTALRERGVDETGRLWISDRCHVVMPWHRAIEAANEAARGAAKIGTTLRGIGPCYSDKAARTGVRMTDLIRPELLREAIDEKLRIINPTLTGVYRAQPLDGDAIYDEYAALGQTLKPMVTDTITMLNQAVREGKSILFEGAQGSLLDIDFGTYPYVTSSNTTACGISAGTGLAPKHIGRIIGVVKAYTTRVGAGPFPTELTDPVGQMLQKLGQEFGATTGRPRRCGWFDAVAVRYTAMISGMDSIALTKLDVLSGQPVVKLCIAYECDDVRYETFPADIDALIRCRPVYIEMPGWSADIGGTRKRADLPKATQNYIARIEQLIGARAEMISVGADRSQMIRQG